MHKHSTSDLNFQSVLQSDVVESRAVKLTRAKQRQIDKLASYVERVTDTDRVFFEPDRKHRVRLASEVEIAQLEIVDGKVMTAPPGMCHFAIVRNVVPGTR